MRRNGAACLERKREGSLPGAHYTHIRGRRPDFVRSSRPHAAADPHRRGARLRAPPAARSCLVRDPRRRAGRPDRPQWHRQVHAAQGHRGRAGPRRRGNPSSRRPAHRARRAGTGTAARGFAAREPRAARRLRRTSRTNATAGAPSRASSSTCTVSASTNRCSPQRRPVASASAPRWRSRWRSSRELLLLDEPTNHLDIDGIALLEDLLAKGPASIFDHARPRVPRRVATRIVELDRGLLRSYPGNYAAYERRKDEQLAAEAVANRKFDKFWAQEEVWIRKGVEARRTRNEGRVQRLEQLRERARARGASASATSSSTSTRASAPASWSRNCRTSPSASADARSSRRSRLRIMRGDRLGLIGPNGAGKSTLIKLMLGELPPDSGDRPARHEPAGRLLRPAARAARPGAQRCRHRQPRLRLGRGRRRATARHQLPRRLPVSAAARGIAGARCSRAASATACCWPACSRARQRAGARRAHQRSRHRVARAARVTLQEYPGTLLLVSHDRAFLDDVVTQTLAAEGDGTLARVRRRLHRLARATAVAEDLTRALTRTSGPCSRQSGRCDQALLQGDARTRRSCRPKSKRSSRSSAISRRA